MNDKIGNSKLITWQDIEPLVFDTKYADFFKSLDPKTFELVLDEQRKPQVVGKILEILRKSDPQNANVKYADRVIKIMRRVATQMGLN